MNIKMLKLRSKGFPQILRDIPSPPKQLYVKGGSLDILLEMPRIAIVGSRNATAYGRDVTYMLSRELADQGIVIISGLAFGIDATAHKAAVEAGGLAIAVLPSPLENIVPVSNRRLADQILEQGGVLISEYAEGEFPMKQNFIARNRLMSGLAQAVLVTEAAEKSGSLHTANFALQQGRDVLAVPGSINSPSSVGTNNLIKAGATPITNTDEVIEALGLRAHNTGISFVKGRNANEQTVLDLLLKGISDGDELLRHSRLETTAYNQVMTMLELGAKIRPLGGNQWSIH